MTPTAVLKVLNITFYDFSCKFYFFKIVILITAKMKYYTVLVKFDIEIIKITILKSKICYNNHKNWILKTKNPIYGVWSNAILQHIVYWRPRLYTETFIFFTSKFGEFREPDFFPERREYRSALRASEKLTSLTRPRGLRGRRVRRSQPQLLLICWGFTAALAVANQRARSLAPDRRRGILWRSGFSEHTRPPRSAGDGPPGPRQALASSPTATPSLRAGVSWPSPSADVRPRKGIKGGTPRATLGVTRIWLTPGELREPAKQTRPRNTAHLTYILLTFYMFYRSKY